MRMLYARNSSFCAFSTAWQFCQSAYSWAAALKSCSLTTFVSEQKNTFSQPILVATKCSVWWWMQTVSSWHQEISVLPCMRGG